MYFYVFLQKRINKKKTFKKALLSKLGNRKVLSIYVFVILPDGSRMDVSFLNYIELI